MKCRVRPLCCLTLTIALLIPCLSYSAVNPADLEALKRLFRAKPCFAKDPATAFEKTWKLFQEPRKQARGLAGDMVGMKASWKSARVLAGTGGVRYNAITGQYRQAALFEVKKCHDS